MGGGSNYGKAQSKFWVTRCVNELKNEELHLRHLMWLSSTEFRDTHEYRGGLEI
jgi:hypothetical protein